MKRALALAIALLALSAPVALAHQGNPHYRSVVKTITPATSGLDVSIDQLRRPPAAAQQERQGRHDPRLQGAAVRAGAGGRHGQGQHRLGGVLPQRGPPRRDARCRPTSRRRRSGRSSPRAGASSGTTTARTGWAPATRRTSRTRTSRRSSTPGRSRSRSTAPKGTIAGTLTWVPLDEGGLPLGAIFAFAALLILLLHRGVHRPPPPRPSPPRNARSPSRRGEPGDRPRPRRAAADPGGGARPRHAAEDRPRSGARSSTRRPAEVVFTFDESVEASFGALRVFDSTGQEVQTGDAFHPNGKGEQIAVKLKPGLGDGTYTATYRVVSADGHPVSSGFVFTVGEAAAPAQSLDQLLAGGGTGRDHEQRAVGRPRRPVRRDRPRPRRADLLLRLLAPRRASPRGRSAPASSA